MVMLDQPNYSPSGPKNSLLHLRNTHIPPNSDFGDVQMADKQECVILIEIGVS